MIRKAPTKLYNDQVNNDLERIFSKTQNGILKIQLKLQKLKITWIFILNKEGFFFFFSLLMVGPTHGGLLQLANSFFNQI